EELAEAGLTSETIAEALRLGSSGDESAGLAPWIASKVFGVRVVTVDPAGWPEDHSGQLPDGGATELRIVWDPLPAPEQCWATYPADVDAMDVDEDPTTKVVDLESAFAVLVANAYRMEPGSAEQLTYFGLLWQKYIWLAPDNGGAKWDALVGVIDAALEQAGGTTLHVGVDYSPAQPMVLRGWMMKSYRALVGYFSRFPERSRPEA